MKFLFLKVLFFLWGCVAVAQGVSSHLYTELSEEKWLPKYSILSIFQDSKGYFWVGTNSGLFKYDGHKTTEYALTHNGKNTLLNNTIRDIAEDKKGNIWIATGSGLGVIQTHPYQVKLALSEGIQNLAVAPDGAVWVTTLDAEHLLYKISPVDAAQETQQPFFRKTDPVVQKMGRGITCFYQTAQGNLWLGTENGVFYLDAQRKKVFETSLTAPVLKIYADQKGVLWVGTRTEGLLAVSPQVQKDAVQLTTLKIYKLGEPQEASFGKVNSITSLQNNQLIAGTFNHLYLGEPISSWNQRFKEPQKTASFFQDNNVLCTLGDREQNIWVGTLYGLYKLKKQEYAFTRIKLATPNYIPVNNHVVKLSADRQGTLWAISNNDGLFQFEPKSNTVSRVEMPVKGRVKNIEQGKSGHYLLNIEDRLYQYKGASLADFKQEHLELLPYTSADIQTMLEVSPGNWWLGTWNNGLLQVALDGKAPDPFFQQVAKMANKVTHIFNLVKDLQGNIWIGYRGNGLIKANPHTKKIQEYHAGKNGLQSDRIVSIYPDKNGNVWVATRGHGVQVYDAQKDRFTSFTTAHGLPSNSVCAFGEDAKGTLWVSTQNGLAKYLPGQPVPFQHYGVQDGIVHPEFSFNAVASGKNNTLYFANLDGIYQLNLSAGNKHSTKAPQLAFSEFQILSEEKEAAQAQQEYLNAIRTKGSFSLPYDHNSFLVSFATLDFTSPEKVKYAYRLKGWEQEWQYTDANGREIQYLDLPAGKYTFEVKSSNAEGIWFDNPISFEVEVQPPFWFSPWAYAVYAVVLLLVVAVVLYFLRRWYKLNNQLKEEAEVLQLQTQQMVYFSDLSHEIKNRLTLILGPLETALTGKKVNKAILHNLYEQALRLKRINEQIINIRKSEAGEFILSVEEGDITQYVADVCERVKPLALVRDIDIAFESGIDNGEVFFDKELLEIILLNLLSNAIKYSEPGANVTITLKSVTIEGPEAEDREPGTYVCCEVKDTGMGIPEEELQNVTSLFYRAKNVQENKEKEGVGLGLNLVQRLVKRHHGWLSIQSRQHEYTTVTFYFPAEKDHYSLTELRPTLANTPIVEELPQQQPAKKEQKPKGNLAIEDKPKVVVVDDEPEIRQLIRETLAEEFDVLEAGNGEEAYQLLLAEAVSLVVSDISMPLLDGISLLKRIKQSPDLNDIPVIILTGKSSASEKYLCLKNNADDFIEKPFSPELLRWRIVGLLKNREILKDKFIRKVAITQQEETRVESPDEKFIHEVVELIDTHMANHDLNVEFLAESMCMSRATLYRKMEDLLSESPSDFIKKARLRKAAALLKEGKFYVSQVAYMVGSKNPKQFTKSFLKEYGVTPTDYMKQEGAPSEKALV
ncbi:hybrid sensor histidine kinase/response regulator transcription factor [Rufibacter quisquiliarum]|uniref:histidine kinase n=1 Tax=Rufibacter quisquiliarum TaxID=1549639 RepID=A0A839GV48_9BACT|nr:hybrid sensor histidine kinase/response regulator transcription factor [Rufibacter quisquiliarum]MBA9078636.1 signal transduction histidine kinase/ligand-binding sensor domain-containing protein/CheY-like chemotaxis protein [Rufibacter quisquiliarum]